MSLWRERSDRVFHDGIVFSSAMSTTRPYIFSCGKSCDVKAMLQISLRSLVMGLGELSTMEPSSRDKGTLSSNLSITNTHWNYRNLCEGRKVAQWMIYDI